MTLLAPREWNPIKRHEPPPRVKLPKKRKCRLNQVSAKRAKALKEYYILRRAYLEKNPWCEAGTVITRAKLPESYSVPRCTVRATQIHHTKRRGPHLNDVDSFCGCCADCHRWIETHTQKSRELGLLV